MNLAFMSAPYGRFCNVERNSVERTEGNGRTNGFPRSGRIVIKPRRPGNRKFALLHKTLFTMGATDAGGLHVRYDDNLTTERPTFVTHLECAMTGERYAADEIHNVSRAGKPLLVRYDLPGVKKTLSKEALASRPPDLWRYRELLPVRRVADIVSLGEAMTPLLPLPKVAAKLGGGELLVKDEGRLPTGSFKARGLVMAVSMAKAFGIKHMAMPTNGNAGAALAAYASHCGIRTTIFCPEDTPEVNVSEIGLQGASVYRVNGLIDDCGKIVAEGKAKVGWFDTSTLKEPYRIEGKKTMGLELAEQLGWTVPDVIFYPTGGGTGLIGMWKAFAELEAIGFIGTKRPRMVAVQAAGCAPMVRAYEEGVEHATRWEDAHTIAAGIRVPQAIGDFLILRAVRESGGFAIAVSDAAITAALEEAAREEGFLMCPEGAATYAAYKQSLKDGRVTHSEQAVLFNCATGLKYPLPPIKRTLDRHKPIDFVAL
jgi:threonine synthase